jgi:hypothetical protein
MGLSQPVPLRDACYSMILFGPPGTGKTTLVEALAYSCRKSLIEVTSSDFLVEGESFIERRARVVFEALSFLTQTVVLFDEFDPMVRSRDTENIHESRNVFSFLTPGLLPKLKQLNERAKLSQVAFVLLTNRIETLDEAAIRSGRFDFKLGVYPPDVVSRIGYFTKSIIKFFGADKLKSTDKNFIERVLRCHSESAGRGLTGIARPGNLSPVSVKVAGNLKPGTMLSFVAGKEDKLNLAEPDAEFSRLANGSDGKWTKLQKRQWGLIEEWDNALRKYVDAGDFHGTLLENLIRISQAIEQVEIQSGKKNPAGSRKTSPAGSRKKSR